MNDIAVSIGNFFGVSSNSKSNSQNRKSSIDWGLLIIVSCLICFGLLMIYSTTGIVSAEKHNDGLLFVKKQLIALCCGIVLALAVLKVSLEFLERISIFALLAAIVMLLLPWLPGLGADAGGATRWIDLGVFRLQPGEFTKFFTILFFAGYIARHERDLETFRSSVLIPGILFLPVAGLLLLQPDFGSTAVIAIVLLIMFVSAGMPLRYIGLAGGVAALSATLLVFLSPYRMQRIEAFMSPFDDASGKGYQLIQSLIAIGVGNITGVGLGESQQKLFFLPAAHNDFIFAVIAEELGLLGGLLVLGLFLLLMWRCVILAIKLRSDPFLFSLTVGMLGLLVVPAFLNVGVVTGLLPTKGLVLPFVSYGGSSIITSLLVVGVLLSISRKTIDAPRQGKVY